MLWYCINNKKKVDGTASAKAPDDVFSIAKKMGFCEVVFFSPQKFKSLFLTRFMAIFTGIQNWIRLYKSVQKDSVIMIQHPNENILIGNRMINFCKRRKNMKFVAMVHDLDSLRETFSIKDPKALDRRNNLADEVLLKKCDFIICHNNAMQEYLISKGFDEGEIIPLGIFDYLHTSKVPKERKLEKSIAVAGNLSKSKCGYLYKLLALNRQYTVHLYGPYYTDNVDEDDTEYHGVLSAEELPGKLQGAFGLVWDGDEIDTCAGSKGEYLRYNNPHKASLFLSANIPIIIWKNAALADFVEKNHIGITIGSLDEIDDFLNNISEIEYYELIHNVSIIGEKLREGYYTTQAIKRVCEIIDPSG